MSLYVSTTYFGDGSKAEDALKDLDSLQIKNIELGSNHAANSADNIKLSKNIEYIVHNYFPPKEDNFIINIASSSVQIQNKSVLFIKNTVSWCHKRGIKYYTIHPGYFAEAISQLGQKGKNRNFDLKFDKKSTRSKNKKKVTEKAIRIINNLYKFAEGKIQLLIENQGSITSKGMTLFDSVEELRLLKNYTGNKLRLNFNLAHALLANMELSNDQVFNFISRNSPFFEVSELRGANDSHLPVFPNKGSIGKLLVNKKDCFRNKNLILEFRNTDKSSLKSSFNAVSQLNGF